MRAKRLFGHYCTLIWRNNICSKLMLNESSIQAHKQFQSTDFVLGKFTQWGYNKDEDANIAFQEFKGRKYISAFAD